MQAPRPVLGREREIRLPLVRRDERRRAVLEKELDLTRRRLIGEGRIPPPLPRRLPRERIDLAATGLEQSDVVIEVGDPGPGIQVGDDSPCEAERSKIAVIPPVFILNTKSPLAAFAVAQGAPPAAMEVYLFRRQADYLRFTCERWRNSGGVYMSGRNLLAAFLEGYESVLPWPEDYPGQIDLLLGQRALDLINLLLDSSYQEDRDLIPEFVGIVERVYQPRFERALSRR